MMTGLLRKVLGGLSFTSAMFIFQACYGTPQDLGPDLLIEGQVKSKSTGMPVKGIKVSVADVMQYQFTDENGEFSFYTELSDQVTIQFKDVDSTLNGSFASKDTLLTSLGDKIYLNILLEERE